jgi:hypothetical protein
MTGGDAEDEIDGEEPENASGDHAASDARRESGSQDECLAGHRCDSPLSLASICHGKSCAAAGSARSPDGTAGWSRNPQQPLNQQSAPTGHSTPCERSCDLSKGALPTTMGWGIGTVRRPARRLSRARYTHHDGGTGGRMESERQQSWSALKRRHAAFAAPFPKCYFIWTVTALFRS